MHHHVIVGNRIFDQAVLIVAADTALHFGNLLDVQLQISNEVLVLGRVDLLIFGMLVGGLLRG